MRILVSACLLGVCCRYDGNSKPCQAVMDLGNENELVPVCPEQLGGLPTPRVPAEIQGERVVSREGRDVTKEYRKGAEEAARLCRLLRCDCAILKARSPSCGCGQVYDGSFSGALVPGDGVTARKLKALGVPVATEETLIDQGIPYQ
ncbi:MAG: DUF523 domain-containing protein [Clostridia bacterium]|nr:DUF523 domain-containing protein [Clostridia bacterium]